MYLQNKYTKCYFSIISSAKSRNITSYTEKHHIIPKSLGGSNAPNNIVKLTAREHYLCHLLLTKMVNDPISKQKMHFAFWAISTFKNNPYLNRYKGHSRIYEKIKQEMSSYKKGKPRDPEVIKKMSESKKGKPRNPDAIEKTRISNTGKKRSEEFCKKMRGINLGHPVSIETREKLRLANLGKTSKTKGIPKPLKTCIHCGTTASTSTINRWHNSNCRHQ